MAVEQGTTHRLSAQPEATSSVVGPLGPDQTNSFPLKPADYVEPNTEGNYSDPAVILDEVDVLLFGYKRSIPQQMVYSISEDPHYKVRNSWITCVAQIAMLERVRERIRRSADLRERVGFYLSYIISPKFEGRPTNAIDIEIGDELLEVLVGVLFASDN